MNVYDYYVTPQEYDLAEQNGIESHVVDSRIRDFGWNKQIAITKPKSKRDRWRYWVEKAENNGITYQTFYKRITKYGYSLEEASEKDLERNPLEKAWKKRKRIVSDEEIKFAEENGINYWTLLSRVKNGMDIDIACKKPPMTRSEIGRMNTQGYKKRSG